MLTFSAIHGQDLIDELGGGRALTKQELEDDKLFFGCYNIGRVSGMTASMEIRDLEEYLGVGEDQILLRFMIDVIHNCIHHATDSQKLQGYDLYLQGLDYPDLDFYPSELILDFKEVIKSEEDVQIPEDQSITQQKSDSLGMAFRETFMQIKNEIQQQEYDDANSFKFLGINMQKLTPTTKLILLLGGFGIVVSVLAYFMSKLNLNQNDDDSKRKGKKKKNSRKKR